MPAIQSCVIEPLWDQFSALLPPRQVRHRLGCHRPRVPDRVVFDTLLQALVFGAAYWRLAGTGCSASTLRRRRDEWMALGVMAQLEALTRAAYDRMIGLQLEDIAVDGCITKAPCGGELSGASPVDRAKQGIKRSTVVDGQGIPLGTVAASARAHDSPLLAPTLDTLGDHLLAPGEMTVHLDRGYDSGKTRRELAQRGMVDRISLRGKTTPVQLSNRWVVERTNSWHNAFKKLVWCTQRTTAVVHFSIAFATAIIIVRRLMREAWTRYRWDGRPRRCP